MTKNEDKLILQVCANNLRLSLRGGQAALCQKNINISYDTIKKCLRTHDVKYRSTIKELIHLGGLKIIPYFGS